MNRRTFLRTTGAAAGLASVTGCLGLFDTRSVRMPPLVEDRPDAAYIPTHVEGMEMAGSTSAGPYEVAMLYSYPHRFWTMETGNTANKVTVSGDDALHLMFSMWDPETSVVVPNASLTAEVLRDGDLVVERSMWPMLSQPMGYHFGDNVPLDGNGTYTVRVTIGGMQARRTRGFEGKFGEPATAEFELEYNEQRRDELMFRNLDDKGEPDALEPMDMGMVPGGQLPPAEEFPGSLVGTATSGDGTFVVSDVAESPLGDGDSYLAVSARTPHRRYVLPFMALSATLERGGETVYDGPLRPTLDPELNYHYGASVPGVESGDALTITVDSPPQVSRHEGYETAFLDMQKMELTV